MVLKRNASLSVYIDGLFENSISSDGFREWSGSNMWIGARGFKIGTQDNVSNYYNGLLDEFRFGMLPGAMSKLNGISKIE